MNEPAEPIHIQPEADPLKGLAGVLPFKPGENSHERRKQRRQTARQREVYREAYAEGVRDGSAEAAAARDELRGAGMLCFVAGAASGAVGTLCLVGIARGFGWI